MSHFSDPTASRAAGNADREIRLLVQARIAQEKGASLTGRQRALLDALRRRPSPMLSAAVENALEERRQDRRKAHSP